MNGGQPVVGCDDNVVLLAGHAFVICNIGIANEVANIDCMLMTGSINRSTLLLQISITLMRAQ
jgi:hypothetical protein